ncbi:galactokinase [Clostridium sp.]|uniref:galactokinase n=1 Tax=Clostridium sp. TaxID=1506 RepID=UPI002630FD70|nr:galactokinase [Clostridium sp.]
MDVNIIKEFKNTFGYDENIKRFFSPGRVNLIGEHTDYNGGYVFPCALSFGTYGAVHLRNDSKCRMYSYNFKEKGIIEFDINNIKFEEEHDWVNYAKGVIHVMEKHGFKINNGFDLYVYGNIPNGAGLSSSASLELLTAVIINELYKFNVDRISLVKYSQEAENKFVGVNCGIMDQFAIGMGKENNAILLDCQSLKYTYCNLDLQDCSIIISNTNKRRGLADSKYNERRQECEEALRILKENLEITSLGSLSIKEFENNKDLIENEIIKKRAKHAVYENQRTLKAKEALSNNDLELFGTLMIESHKSLKEDYEVTGIELDTLVDLANNQEGTLGSRMTGAGFGGCTVSLVRNKNIDAFIDTVGERYKNIIGYSPSFYIAKTGDGTREI